MQSKPSVCKTTMCAWVVVVITLLACANASSTTTTNDHVTVLSNNVRDSPEGADLNTVRYLRDQGKGNRNAEGEERGVTDQLRSFTNWLRNTKLGQKFLNSRLGQWLMSSKVNQTFQTTKVDPKPQNNWPVKEKVELESLKRKFQLEQKAKLDEKIQDVKPKPMVPGPKPSSKLEQDSNRYGPEFKFFFEKSTWIDDLEQSVVKNLIEKNQATNANLFKNKIHPDNFAREIKISPLTHTVYDMATYPARFKRWNDYKAYWKAHQNVN